ncbi:hypothetical protein [Companilactobacillus kimchii]|uniref:Uncharacterized protein n=2 Tax=Companilactobacillus kimchii TaxID=2801452 RepID=A0ABR5NUM9_9LACO|nr:hypothetical protein [Companilactobacillus kimchii]KAE9557367.1 hypothetical protein ATN91_04275 [Companilactobacillus kimchii]KRK52474.1 hypothetical protein FC97_GL000276 [Companilactobacillus kimchii DSM 13961 = JCM 10707]OWF32592.1 hypothetical protein LKACC12383_01815 [Companilactobacillus kimchii]GEO47393.1 hypothetical protein LKI01_13920 [Companilactobacillus paralimentarius]
MSSTESIRKDLDGIKTKIKYKEANDSTDSANDLKNKDIIDSEGNLKMNNFGSFISCKHGLPNNNDLRKLLKNHPNKFTSKYFYDTEKCDFSFNDSFFGEEDFNNDYMFLGLNVAARGDDKKDDGGVKTKAYTLAGWKNFHDMNPKTRTNTCKLFMQLNNDRFKGCYITDLIKYKVDSNADHLSRDLFLASNNKCSFLYNSNDIYKVSNNKDIATVGDKRIELYKEWYKKDSEDKIRKDIHNNNSIFDKSVQIFIEECNIIQPKHLVAFGGDVYRALKRFKETKAVKSSNASNVNIGKLIDNAIWLDHYSGYSKNFIKWFEEQPNEHIPDYVQKLNS